METESRYDQLVRQNELTKTVAEKLFKILSDCEIVLLCDDSGSMQNTIVEPATNKKTTRWLELKKLASVIIEFVTAINPNGLDIYFLNRPKLSNVTSTLTLQTVFSDLPDGNTPLIGTIKEIYADKRYIPANRQLLIVIVTDGCPTDGSLRELFRTLISKRSNVHISLAECTSEASVMEYLDEWDNQIPNFDNTDDYREELQRVRAAKGQDFKFDYTDYVIKILLATFDRKYFNLDQQNACENCCNII